MRPVRQPTSSTDGAKNGGVPSDELSKRPRLFIGNGILLVVISRDRVIWGVKARRGSRGVLNPVQPLGRCLIDQACNTQVSVHRPPLQSAVWTREVDAGHGVELCWFSERVDHQRCVNEILLGHADGAVEHHVAVWRRFGLSSANVHSSVGASSSHQFRSSWVVIDCSL